MSLGAGTSPRIHLRQGAATDTGRVRTGNEDAFGVAAELGLFVVADGLGGHQAGDVASATAVEGFLAAVRVDLMPDDADRASVLRHAISAAHDAVAAAAGEKPALTGMGTTLVAAWISPEGRMWVANVGDSRCYRFRGAELTQLSTDDSLLEELRRRGNLPDDPVRWPARAQLTQAVGLQSTVLPHVERSEVAPGDRILLCTDGLTDMLSSDEITEMLSEHDDPQEACVRLVGSANLRGGLDNVTVVVVDIEAPVADQTPGAGEGMAS